MQKTELLYEGKAKKVYATENPDYCIVSYKDDATAFNGLKKGTIVGKGVVNNRMSNFMFQLLEKHGIKTHFVEELSDRDTVVRKVSIVPLEVIVRNKAAGSLSKRLGLEEGTSSTSRSNSARPPTARLSSQTRFPRIPAASGTSIPMKSSIRTVSAATWAVWKRLMPK